MKVLFTLLSLLFLFNTGYCSYTPPPSGSGIDADGENTAGSLTVNSYIQLSPTQENSIRLVNDSGVISVLKFTNAWINTGSLLMAEVDTLDTILNRGATSNVSILLGSSPFPGSSSDKLRVAGTGSFTNLKSSTITSTTSNFTNNFSTTLYSTYIRGPSTSSGPILYTGSGNILISGKGSFIIGGLNGVVQSFATYISGSTGFIGIGKQADSIHSLDTNGSIRAASIVLTNNPGAGKVLTSNETGVATWETPTGGSSTLPTFIPYLANGGAGGQSCNYYCTTEGGYQGCAFSIGELGAPELLDNCEVTNPQQCLCYD